MINAQTNQHLGHTSVQEGAPRSSSYKWMILALLCLLYGSFGLIHRAIAPLVTPILRDLAISYSEMGFILGGWQLTYIGGALVAGAVIDRWGIRKSLFAGALVMSLSSVLRYFARDFGTMLFAVALFGAGAPMISIGCPKLISVWFQGKSRGSAVGIYLSGAYAGGLAGLTLTNSLVMPLTGYSWRLTFVCYGLVCLGIALLWWFLTTEPSASIAGEPIGIIGTFRGIVGIRNVQIVLTMGFLVFVTLHGFNSWLPKILEAKGLSPTMAGFKASVPIAAGIPALLLIPRLVSSSGRGRFVALSAVLAPLSLFLVIGTSDLLQLAALSLFGVLQSSYVPILTLILMDTPEVEPRFMGSVGGLFFCIADVGGFFGPFIVGVLVDITGTFWSAILFCALINLVVAGLTFLLRSS